MSSTGCAAPFEPFDPLAPLTATSARGRTGRSAGPGTGAGMISWPRCGAQVRQRPSASFQQFAHVYWRHVMQKLKVLWKASSWWEVVLALGLAPGRGHRLVHRRVVGQDEVLQAARQRP